MNCYRGCSKGSRVGVGAMAPSRRSAILLPQTKLFLNINKHMGREFCHLYSYVKNCMIEDMRDKICR